MANSNFNFPFKINFMYKNSPFFLLFFSLSFIFYPHEVSSQTRYSGRTHSSSHGGYYKGGKGSSHKGGHYKNRRTSNHYGRHKR